MLTYVSRFWSGGFEPFWPHFVLLTLSVLASIAVGAGIIFERPKYSAAVHRVAFWLVVGGIVIEAACTIFLFVFDEGISTSQQSKIVAGEIETLRVKVDALRAQLAVLKILQPRNLSDEAQKRIIEKLAPLGAQPFGLAITPAMEEGSELPKQLGALLLRDCKWQMFKLPGRYQGLEGIGTTDSSGVVVSYDLTNEALKTAAETLVTALGDEGIASRAEAYDSQSSPDMKAIIQIAIGTKPLFLREIEEVLPLPQK
jgi:hypothetical protein